MILDYLAQRYPSITGVFEERLQRLLVRIGEWPESAEPVAERPGVRGVPLVRYPYKFFSGSPAKRSKSCTSTPPRGGRRGSRARNRVTMAIPEIFR